MRRAHVYERSAIRVARGPRPEPTEDYGPAARAALLALPDLFRAADAAGAVTLARYLGQALSEAEGIVRRACDPSPDLPTLRHLAGRTHASAAEIGIACRMAPAEVRSRLVMLESMRLVAGAFSADAVA